jgi:hypothetical protein
VLGDGFSDLEQGFELTPGVFQGDRGSHFRGGKNRVRHKRQNSTGVGGGSTKGACSLGWAKFSVYL